MRLAATILPVILLLHAGPAAAETLLLREPDVSARGVVFVYGGDLWLAPRDGGDARRLTSFPGAESYPRFSPDGAWIAFTGAYDGNSDVYVIPAEGGEPQRLTWHPGNDVVRGWTPDGTSVVFSSGRENPRLDSPRFWTVPREGGFPEPMPMPRAHRGEIAPDGRHVVYEMVSSWETEFRNYRGGQNRPIWILDLDTFAVEELPWDGSRDTDPVYEGDAVYFLSDRDYAVNVYAYDHAAKTVRQLTHFKDFDVKNLQSGDGVLIFECGGRLYTLDPAGNGPKELAITVRGDFPWARPHWEDAAPMATGARLSPTGKRAAFEARGEIFTVPAEHGDVRNLSADSGAADRAPSWSPDGANIAWFSDASGEYRLVIADPQGEHRREITVPHPTYFYDPRWSPDSKHIAFTDAGRDLLVVDAASGKATRVPGEGYAHPIRTIYPVWSPDSRWIAYVRLGDNQYHAIWVYSLADGSTHRITDGMADCRAPAWDRDGKYLYFLGSTDYGLNVGWLDMGNFDHPVTSEVYLTVLAADENSPLTPRSDDETPKTDADAAGDDEDKGDDAGEETPEVRIDFDGIERRMEALDLPESEYLALAAGEAGVLFVAESEEEDAESEDGEAPFTLQRYTLEKREAEPLLEGVTAFDLSADGKKLLYGAGGVWGIVDSSTPGAVGDGKLTLADLRAYVDPRAEWRQIFHEAWRFQRDYFYVRNVHGLDMDDVYARYAPLVEQVRHRSDLTYLLDVLGGETSVGHSFVFGGDFPTVDTVPVGMLGADLEPADGGWRIARIYTGEGWNPEIHAPLAVPGLDVHEGDYVVAVNGRPLSGFKNPYAAFDRTAGNQTVVSVNTRPAADGAREVTVVPVPDETQLRTAAWMEGNRRRVDELSGGKIGYVWIPDTGSGGYTNFNRYYFAQQDKPGIVIDERYNHGGSAADYIIDLTSRPLLGYFSNPIGDHKPFTNPGAGIWGPKVMIANEMSGSGGDLLPYMFKARKVGPVVGKRTWGGLVGIWDVPTLVDGGLITAPRGGYYNNQGEWDVENKGVSPDVEVENTPAEVIAGHDPQLERAVQVAMEMLRENPVVLRPQPPDPVRVKRPH